MRTLLLLALILGLSAPRAAACSCAQTPEAEGFAHSGLVFLGQVVSIKQADYGFDVTFDVGEVFKGPATAGKTVRIHTGEGGGDCGYHFAVGRAYVVFAYGSAKDGWDTGICSHTSADVAAEHLRALRDLAVAAAKAEPAGE